MKKLEMCGTTGPIYVFKSLVCYIHMLGAWSSFLRIHFSLLLFLSDVPVPAVLLDFLPQRVLR
jgi:hypothetical protein